MRQLSSILLLTLILICTAIQSCTQPQITMSSPDMPCRFDDWLQQNDCLAGKIPGFAGYTLEDCMMVVYLTSLEEEESARAILEPLFRESQYGREYCRAGTRVGVRKVRYTWAQLREWQKRAFNTLTGLFKGLTVTGINEEKNAVFVIVQTESYATRGREILTGQGILNDALIFSTGMRSGRPPMGLFRDGELVIPAFISGNVQIGELVLGKTTLKEAEKMFPKAPPEALGEVRPRKPAGYPEAKVGEVSPEPQLVFNPWGSTYTLFFDKNQILVLVEELGSAFEGQTLAEVQAEYPGLRRTASFDDVYEMQTEVTPCVALMLIFDAEFHEALQAAYVYTCKTER